MDEYLYIFGGAIGDALLGVHIGRTLAANKKGARITLLSTRKNNFVKELVAPIPFVHLKEMPKESLRSWFALVGLMLRPHKSVVYEPFSSPMPLWWLLVLWCASHRKGGIEVHYQSRSQRAPKRAKVLELAYQSESVFDTTVNVLEAWGVPVHSRPKPQLDVVRDCSDVSLPQTPYAIFHFFAGIHKRTASVALANAVLRAARATLPEYAFVVTAAAKETIEAGEVMRGISNASVEIGLRADQVLCLLKGAAVFVGADTGLTHIAQHLGVPTVVLGHTYNPSWLPQYNQPAKVVYSLPDIEPLVVAEAMQKVLDTK